MAQASKRRPEALQISDAGALAKSCWTLRTLQCDRLRRCLLCAKSVRRSARASMSLVDIQAAPHPALAGDSHIDFSMPHSRSFSRVATSKDDLGHLLSAGLTKMPGSARADAGKPC